MSWYFTRSGEQQGPVELADLRQMAAAGMLHPQDLVWHEGMPQWVDAASVSEVFAGMSFPRSPGNPAVTPVAPLAYYAQQPRTLRYAGFWLRAGAYLIDILILFVINIIVGAVIGGILGAAGLLQSREGVAALRVLVELASMVVDWMYFALQESSPYQATLGKRIVGLKVTDLEGRQIGFGRATGRHFAKILSALILCIGYMMAGFTERKQALHDLIAGTLVVRS